MNNQEKLIMSEDDYQKIAFLIKGVNPEVAEPLEEELDRATVVPARELPPDVVAMNTKVVFKDLDSGKESTAILVYPEDVNVAENKISILTPVGSALIGLKVGQLIQWSFPNNKNKKLLVVSVNR